MKMPLLQRFTLPQQLSLALLVSACAHAALLAWPHPETALKKARPSGHGHRPVLTVVSLVHSAPIPHLASPKVAPPIKAQPPAVLRPPNPSPRTSPVEAYISPTSAVTTAAITTTDAASSPNTPDATPQASPPASAAGQRFAGLFAPILAEPLGRARWMRHRPEMQSPPPEQARQQALWALRSEFQQRLESWRTAKHTHNLAFDCEFRVDYDQGQGSVVCQDEQDTAQLWSLMQGLLRPLPTENAPVTMTCLRLTPTQLAEQTCSTSTL